ncbi:hypothetical protein NW754_001328 [Fusarium falciforme]|nr:hypothetical protein NW754_001328 [Fusarium falciforme]
MAAIADSSMQAATNMMHEYEVKLLLNPTAFLDKNRKKIYTASWSPRTGKIENEDNLELIYKKRHVIIGGDIDAALTMASNDGFDACDADDAKYESDFESIIVSPTES